MILQYERRQHAAHYGSTAYVGHDIEQWTFCNPENKRDPEIPDNATYAVGYVHEGKQYWVYERVAPMTGTCRWCEDRERGTKGP